MAGLVKNELWVWAGICNKKSFLKLVPLSIFQVIWKERNSFAFDEIEGEIVKITDGWLNIFGSFVFSHDTYRMENFGNVVDLLIEF